MIWFYAILIALGWTFWAALLKMVGKTTSPLCILAWISLFYALTALPFWYKASSGIRWSLLLLLLLAAVAAQIGNYFFYSAVSRFELSRLPIMADTLLVACLTVVGFLIFKEQFDILKLAGLVLILAGIFMLGR